MNGYLGQFPVDIETTRYKGFTKEQWAMEYIGCYGGIDGAHHKDWVLDQVARILHGTPIKLVEARWDNGHIELRFSTQEPTKEYHEWVADMRGEMDEEGDYEYDYDEGIAP